MGQASFLSSYLRACLLYVNMHASSRDVDGIFTCRLIQQMTVCTKPRACLQLAALLRRPPPRRWGPR